MISLSRHPERSRPKDGVVEGPFLSMHHQNRSLHCASLRPRSGQALRSASVGMTGFWSRIFGIAMAGLAVLLALAAAAQPASVPAPERNAETGLAFPDMIGPARKVGSIDYSQTKGMPELGWAWTYETQATTTTFHIYNFGIGTIPPGATSGPVLTQFQQATADIEIGAKTGRYEQLKPSQ